MKLNLIIETAHSRIAKKGEIWREMCEHTLPCYFVPVICGCHPVWLGRVRAGGLVKEKDPVHIDSDQPVRGPAVMQVSNVPTMLF